MVWGYERSWNGEIGDALNINTLEACMKFSNKKTPYLTLMSIF